MPSGQGHFFCCFSITPTLTPPPSVQDHAKHTNTHWFPLWDSERELFLGIPFHCPLWTMIANEQRGPFKSALDLPGIGSSTSNTLVTLWPTTSIGSLLTTGLKSNSLKLQQGGSPQPVASFVSGKTHPSVTGASPSFLNKELQAFAQAVPLPAMPFPLSPLSRILWLIENLPGGEEARLSRKCEGLGVIPDLVI